MRLVLDTNTVVSGLFWAGAPGQLQDAARDGKVELYTSPALLGELARVLRRPKFSARVRGLSASIDELIEGYGELARLVNPAAIAPVVIADPEDDHVLACALAAKADLVVSGDSCRSVKCCPREAISARPVWSLGRGPRPAGDLLRALVG